MGLENARPMRPYLVRQILQRRIRYLDERVTAMKGTGAPTRMYETEKRALEIVLESYMQAIQIARKVGETP